MEVLLFCLALGIIILGVRATRKKIRNDIDKMDDDGWE